MEKCEMLQTSKLNDALNIIAGTECCGLYLQLMVTSD